MDFCNLHILFLVLFFYMLLFRFSSFIYIFLSIKKYIFIFCILFLEFLV